MHHISMVNHSRQILELSYTPGCSRNGNSPPSLPDCTDSRRLAASELAWGASGPCGVLQSCCKYFDGGGRELPAVALTQRCQALQHPHTHSLWEAARLLGTEEAGEAADSRVHG